MAKKLCLSIGIVLVAVLLSMPPVDAGMHTKKEAPLYTTLKIYACPWGILTRMTLHVDDVRRFGHYYAETTDGHRISRIADIVAGGKKKYTPWNPYEPARIVFDFYSDDGTIDTFFAEAGYICELETKTCWETDFTKLSKIGEIINEDVWKPMEIEGGKR